MIDFSKELKPQKPVHLRQHLISIFLLLKINPQNLQRMILTKIINLWWVTLDYVDKYRIIPSMNVMKFVELILKLVHSNPFLTIITNLDEILINAASRVLGLHYFLHGWNILLQQMKLIVYIVFYLVSQLNNLQRSLSLLMDLIVGEKLGMATSVRF